MTAAELRYRPEVFDVADAAQAKQIILTAESGTSTDERWAKETPFLGADIGSSLMLGDSSVVLDYGCGIGRLSKELIERFNCSVIGVDISASMRQLAVEYVNSDRFSVVSPDMLGSLIEKGVKVDACFSVWVLQHCLDVHKELRTIKKALKAEGLLYILNCHNQVIPTDAGWATSGVNVLSLLQQEFSQLQLSKLPVECTTPDVAEATYITLLKNDKQAVKSKFTGDRFSGLSCFIDRLARDLYPENPSELHNDITEKVIRHMVEKYPVGAGTKILDVGCGQGLALEHFKNMGAKALGITLGDDDITACLKLGFDVRKMDQSFLDFADDAYSPWQVSTGS
jgi:cyclopropane fatty-acyl-phospholipid synthase-like methyltransferase